jgi:hypothetical protein
VSERSRHLRWFGGLYLASLVGMALIALLVHALLRLLR